VVAKALMELAILNTGSMRKGKGKEGGKVEKRRQGVSIMANYLVGFLFIGSPSFRDMLEQAKRLKAL
jgi:hypothetical protein